MISLWGRGNKGQGDDTPGPFPKLPTAREMIEDIENIKKNDPILTLAAVINKHKDSTRGSTLDSDLREYAAAIKKQRRRRESQSNSNPSSPSTSHPHPLHSHWSSSQKKSRSRQNSHSVPESDIQSDDDSERTTRKGGDHLTYDNLKHFLTTIEHSQELVSNLEVEFKQLFTDITQHYKHQDVPGRRNNKKGNKTSEKMKDQEDDDDSALL